MLHKKLPTHYWESQTAWTLAGDGIHRRTLFFQLPWEHLCWRTLCSSPAAASLCFCLSLILFLLWYFITENWFSIFWQDFVLSFSAWWAFIHTSGIQRVLLLLMSFWTPSNMTALRMTSIIKGVKKNSTFFHCIQYQFLYLTILRTNPLITWLNT